MDGDSDHEAGTATILGDALPADRLAVPVHPWQYDLPHPRPAHRSGAGCALEHGILRDHGRIGLPFHPTSSVRTLYQPELDRFLKTSLNVRITNCLRKNSAYELAGAPALSRVLAGSARGGRASGCSRTGRRSVALPQRCGPPADRHAVLEGLGTIVRAGIANRTAPANGCTSPGRSPRRSPTRAARRPGSPLSPTRPTGELGAHLVAALPRPARAAGAHPVGAARHRAGAAPQNVLVARRGNLPTGVLARDLEGTKRSVTSTRRRSAALPADVARAAAYDEERGRQRIGYRLFVNHLTELAGALADLALTSAPGMCRFEDELWSTVADVVAGVSARLGSPPRLRALIEGKSLPAKTISPGPLGARRRPVRGLRAVPESAGPVNPVTDAVLAAAVEEPGPAYVYDLRHLDGHVRAIRAALPERVGLLHAVKANPIRSCCG